MRNGNQEHQDQNDNQKEQNLGLTTRQIYYRNLTPVREQDREISDTRG